MKKHVNDKHGGQTDHILVEFDHVLPLCGPGHVEKNILSAAISVLWDLIGLETRTSRSTGAKGIYFLLSESISKHLNLFLYKNTLCLLGLEMPEIRHKMII